MSRARRQHTRSPGIDGTAVYLLEEAHLHEPVALVQDQVLDSARRLERGAIGPAGRSGGRGGWGVRDWIRFRVPWHGASAVPAQVHTAVLHEPDEPHRGRDQNV